MAFFLTISTVFLLSLVPSFSLLYAFEIPDNETFSKINRVLEMKLSDLVAAVTQIDFARSVYKLDSSIKLERVNGEDVLNLVLRKVRKLLEKKKTALKKLVVKAEEKFSKFERRQRSILTLEDVSFFNVKEPKSTSKMRFSSHFRQKVVYEESGVHIPLEIYDGWMGPRYKEAWWHDPEILNGLNWTAGLDEVFKENLKNDPTLRWQYFGSYFGFMRVYPAFRWPEHPSLPDLFDVRRRSWYIQGSVTPKDVIILIDRSGSVHGPTLDIMKITARALLNSLGENDFVNVAWFNNKVRWVIPCLNDLVQATAQIRRLLGEAVERLTESNLTSYATALDFAFEAFKKFEERKKPWAGSDCHKIIMFLSDGGTEWPSDLVTKHCNESRNGRIKIFTFACGPHPIPTVVLKEMACATGGYFSPITALGSVRVKIQDYVKVLSRPLAFSRDDNMYQWHSFYRDIGGLGVVTTVTLPVFNKNSQNTSGNLLGVMGVDTPVEEMTGLFPKHLLGSFGYPFAINTNGFVIFHPRLHDHIVFIEDPQNIYLTDLEGASEKVEEMEKGMIDGTQGFLRGYKSIVPVGLGHAILVDMDYFYGPVEPSTFRFGVAVPSGHVVATVNVPDMEDSLGILSEFNGILLAPWDFCLSEELQGDLTIEHLVSRILINYTSCDENLVSHLLWDAEKIRRIENHWNRSSAPGVWSRFAITSGGLTFVHSSKYAEDYKRQADPLKNNLFKRASRSSGFVLSVAKGHRQEVTVAGRVTVGDSYVAAVIGAEIEQELIQQVFDETTGSGVEGICNSSEFLHCYLLNDGGIITASNVKTSKAGDFIGLHDPELLEILISGRVFEREYRYNYQSWCSKETLQFQTTAATRPFSLFTLLYEAITSFHWNLLYTTLLYFVSSVSAWKKSETSAAFLDYGNHSCVTRSAWYYHSGALDHAGAFNCTSRTRTFRASFLSNVSLVFLMAQPPCNDAPNLRVVGLDPEEDIEPDHCSRQQHYRLRPGKCYSQTPKDIFSDCGATSAGSVLFSSATALVAQSFLFLLKVTL